MILTETVEVNISNKNINYYKVKGYECKVNNIICVKIQDLTKGSHERIIVKCDNCGKEKEMTYHSYNVNFYNSDSHYSCSKCSVEKTKKTNLEKYGVEHASQSKEIREKVKKTCLERYGVEYVIQNEDIMNKFKNIMFERYGVERRETCNKSLKSMCYIQIVTVKPTRQGIKAEYIRSNFNLPEGQII